MPVFSQGQVVGEAAGRTLRVRVFPCRVHAARGTGCAGPPKQTPDVRSVLSAYPRYLAVDCAGSQTPWAANPPFLHPPPLRSTPQLSSPPAPLLPTRSHL